MKFQISAVACLVLVLAGCQSSQSGQSDSARVTIFKPNSTPVDRRIAFDDCQQAALRGGGKKDGKAQADYINKCMQNRGFNMIEKLPVCETAEARRRALRDRQPRSLSEMKCSSGVALDRYS